MVANLSIGRKKYAAHELELREAQSRSAELRRELLGLARQDSESFEQVLRATRMPQATTDEQRARDRALSAANLEASRVPLRPGLPRDP
jgi:formiminotetrahydrofolate cyclodeaminase